MNFGSVYVIKISHTLIETFHLPSSLVYSELNIDSSCSDACVLFCWPGLEKIHELTNTPTQYEVRFDLGFGSDRTYAVYDNFKVAPSKQKFKLTIGNYKGNAGELDYLMMPTKLYEAKSCY